MATKVYNFTVFSVDETENLGKNIAKILEENSIHTAFIAMRGEMGVGKTAFTRGFASHFGINNVKSPTYALLNEYRGRANIYHFDMYRIESEDDLISIGYDEYVERRGYVVCEWSENICEFLPSECIFVSISRLEGNENARKIELSFSGKGLSSIDLLKGDLK